MPKYNFELTRAEFAAVASGETVILVCPADPSVSVELSWPDKNVHDGQQGQPHEGW